MQIRHLLAILLGTALQGTHTLVALQNTSASSTSAQSTPAQQRINDARRQMTADPGHAQAYTDLALALIRRARETSDPAYLAEAGSAINQGLQVAPADFQLHKAQVALLLARNQWKDALAAAQPLNRRNPDDVTLYGYIAEADTALGNYEDADKSAQWMLNMRPNNVAGLIEGAALRQLYGDDSGAIEFLSQAFAETPQVEPEELAWIANRITEIELASGQLLVAEKTLARAQELFPDYPSTNVLLAQLRIAQHKPEEAIPLLEQQLAGEQARHIPPAGTLLLLAEAVKQAGKPGSASTFARFEQAALAAAGQPGHDLDTNNLVLYEAGLPGETAPNAALALRLAQQAIAERHDVLTLDAYAWALYANGRYQDADIQINRALDVGLHSAGMDEHAGEIALKLNRTSDAARHLARAIQDDPNSPDADQATRLRGGQQTLFASAAPPVEALPAPSPSRTVEIPVTPLNLINLKKDTGGVPTSLLIPRATSTDRTIQKMQSLVAARPDEPSGYSQLGAAFFQRARETGDVEDYNLAEQALNKSLSLLSNDLPAAIPLETMAEVCMGEHRFQDALDYAQRALALGSGDLSPFAIVGDAYADMGEYEKAGIAYSRLQASTNPADVHAAYAQTSRAAYLTFAAGDTDRAIAEMQAAIGEGLEAKLPAENLAWLYYELGDFSYQGGKLQAAADAYFTALTVYPGDYRALAGLAKVRASQQKFEDAITLYQGAIAVVPMPIYIAELGDIYAKISRTGEAEKQFKLVEYIGRLGHINQVLHNRDLALFYADHDRNLSEALALAHKEFEVRSDIYTWDALAWVLYKSGKYPEASQAMDHALRLGTKDATLLFHAGMIAARLGQVADSTSKLDQAMLINPHFSVLYADQAARQLAALHKGQSVLARNAQTAGRLSGKEDPTQR